MGFGGADIPSFVHAPLLQLVSGDLFSQQGGEAKISAATLSRLERGVSVTLPDVATLEKLAKWLGTTVGHLLAENAGKKGTKTPEASTPEIVEVHLRADKNLAPKTARALAEMFKVLYEQASKK